MKENRYTPFKKLYQLALEATGEQKADYKKAVKYFFLAYVAQGLVFGMFYPLFSTIFNETVDVQKALLIFGIMVVLSIVSLIAKWRGHNFDFTGNIVDITNNLRLKLGENLRRMPLEDLSYYKTGELNAIFSNNVEEAVMSLGTITSMIVELITVPVTMVVVTFFVDWRLAVFMMILFPLAIPLYKRIRNTNVKEKSDFNRANAELEAGFIEYIQGLPILRAVNKTGRNEKKLQSHIKSVRKIQISNLMRTQLPYVLMGLLIEGVLMILLFFGAYFVFGNTLELMTLGACLVVVARLVEPTSLFVAVINIFEVTDIALKQVNKILGIKPLPCKEPGDKPKGYDIQFDGVDFTYHNQVDKTIKDVDFYLPERTMTAIVGHSGCGKTTLTRLLMRYADIQNGSISIGGVDIRHMDHDVLMKLISVVFQDVYLFDDTIINNITMDSSIGTAGAVDKAAKAAYCHEFIDRLEDGYKTIVGDIGGSLSGGERQRISIARAILKDSPIVILDEPTAALDTESEVSVQKAIDELVEEKTVIVIAHRLSTIVGADKILVMDQGKIVEQGKHHELMELKGKYYDMWSAQQRVKAWSVVS